MKVKRPCLLLALFFTSGTAIASPSLPILVIAAIVIACSISLIYLYSHKLLTRLAVLMLMLSALTSFISFRSTKTSIDKKQKILACFGDMSIRLHGVIETFTVNEGKVHIRVNNSLISSKYGSKSEAEAVLGNQSLSGSDDIGTDQDRSSSSLTDRYDQPVGNIMVYMDEADLSTPSLYPGQLVDITGTIAASSVPRNDGEFNFDLYYRSLGISGSIYGDSVTIAGGDPKPYQVMLHKIRSYISLSLSMVCTPIDLGIYKALLIGEKGSMDEDIKKLYQDSGIAHILAVSGLHLSIIGSGFYDLLRYMGISQTVSGLLGAIIILLYGILTGSSGSAMRAVIMLIMKFLSISRGRSYDLLSALSIACILLLLSSPYLLFTFGFQLSFGAVLSIGLASELPVHLKTVGNALRTALAIQLFTLPILLYHGFTYPLYSVLLNIIVLPFMSYVMYSGLLSVCIFSVSELLARLSIGGGHYILLVYTWLCETVSGWPKALLVPGRPSEARIIVYYSVLYFIYVISLPRKSGEVSATTDKSIMRFLDNFKISRYGLIIVFLSISLLHHPSPSALEITAIDVGQGDGFVIRDGRSGVVFTIDGGSTSKKDIGENTFVPYLKSQGISCIDIAFISHSDQDHTSGILYLLENSDIEIKKLVLSMPAVSDERYDDIRLLAENHGTEVTYVEAGDIFKSGDLELHCYYPSVGVSSYIEDPNKHSSGMLLNYGDFSMLFTGDMDKDCEYDMLANMGNIDIDILKAGHHGSSTATSDMLLTMTTPEYALLSYGENNRYGHPHRETLDCLASHSVETICTAENGELRITSDGHGFEIKKSPPVG